MTAPTTAFFPTQNGTLHAESVPLADIAVRFGTPCYVYSRTALEAALDRKSTRLNSSH